MCTLNSAPIAIVLAFGLLDLFASMAMLGNTLLEWKDEIVRMWRFSKTNSITEGLHRRVDEILNRAYGMRIFQMKLNYLIIKK